MFASRGWRGLCGLSLALAFGCGAQPPASHSPAAEADPERHAEAVREHERQVKESHELDQRFARPPKE